MRTKLEIRSSKSKIRKKSKARIPIAPVSRHRFWIAISIPPTRPISAFGFRVKRDSRGGSGSLLSRPFRLPSPVRASPRSTIARAELRSAVAGFASVQPSPNQSEDVIN